ncbi:MAG: carboxymuconolactone decarboxylase family protein [Anaerolineales bacterium]|nr:carboxymuconolactone decarboxylase family protein [Anaerolineales bacterium]
MITNGYDFSVLFGLESEANWQLTEAIRPDITQVISRVAEAFFAQGKLPPTIKQLIAMAISEKNNCNVCSRLHTAALEKLGVPKETIERCIINPDEAQIPPAQRELLKFAVKTAKSPQEVTTAEFNRLRDQGITDEEILEVAMIASFTNFLNTWFDVKPLPVE